MMDTFASSGTGFAGRRFGTSITQSSPPVYDSTRIQTTFHQLAQALTVLSSATDLFLDKDISPEDTRRVIIWLQPNARIAEEALHYLRDYDFFRREAGMELTQCLTVLILAADMIAQGQLTRDGSQDAFALVRRNAERAMRSLQELRASAR